MNPERLAAELAAEVTELYQRMDVVAQRLDDAGHAMLYDRRNEKGEELSEAIWLIRCATLASASARQIHGVYAAVRAAAAKGRPS